MVKGVGHLGHDEVIEAGGREFDPRPMPSFQNSEFIWNVVLVGVASCKCLLLPHLSPLCLANLLFACHPLCYGLSYMSVWANSCVLCLGAAERIRLAGSRQLV